MKNTPFIYGTTVSLKSFTDREKDAEKLYNNLTEGINTTIISPRRWGKSSLVEKVMHDIKTKNKNIIAVQIDLFSASSGEEFLELFAREVIMASSTKWQDWVKAAKEFFSRLIPQITIGVDPQTDFRIGFNWAELNKYPDEILNLPERMAVKLGKPCIICLDEFQNLASFAGFAGFEKKMRSVWQRQKNATYCLFGSKRHMMTDIFNNSSKPFYRFGDIMLLNKIPTEKWVTFIVDGFKKSGKTIHPEMARKIPALMKDHSWYVQQLAHYTWQKTEKAAGLEELSAALVELLNANSPLYQKDAESISVTQLNFLKAVACNETRLTSAAVMQKYRLGTPRNVQKNRIVLMENDIIDLENGKHVFLDPAFELWFRMQYFGEKYLNNPAIAKHSSKR
ncbi:MAG: ATPase [Bacteroidetes bacterium GWF2_43_63]|nr:MAG: ATPase [Bacteroidetes bacterium GWE2_42_42]OFY53545.1 MAG: ATPase [Bacteroidetes bacterium GWF2_43_63]